MRHHGGCWRLPSYTHSGTQPGLSREPFIGWQGNQADAGRFLGARLFVDRKHPGRRDEQTFRSRLRLPRDCRYLLGPLPTEVRRQSSVEAVLVAGVVSDETGAAVHFSCHPADSIHYVMYVT